MTVVRAASAGDAAAIAALLDELGYPASADAVARRLEAFAAPGSRVQVAELDGDVVGVVATHVFPRLNDDSPACRIVSLVVAGRSRRRGVGAALVAAAEAEARQAGAGRLDVTSGDWRPEAHAFYSGIGFTGNGRRFVRALR